MITALTVERAAEAINKELDRLVEEAPVPYNELFQAARYSLLAPGKRIRPLLAIATADMLGGDWETAITPACALEMVHTYSLIHDDLPCMDDDDFRRGRPTLHRATSESMAVLAGDFLLTYAFEVLSTSPQLADSQRLALITLLAQSSGARGMIGGQVMDMASTGKEIPEQTLQMLHDLKTGALFIAAFQFGGIIANSPSPLLELCGKKLGYLFQVVDDILDVTASVEKHGKSASSDAAKNKATAISLLGFEAARAKAVTLAEELLSLISQFPGDSTLLRSLIDKVTSRI